MASSGYFRTPNQVVDDYLSRLGAGPFVILMCLARHKNADDVCFPSISHLQDVTNMARSTVIRHLETLEELGVIRRDLPPGRRATYTILPMPNWFQNATGSKIEPVAKSNRTGSKTEPVLVAPCSPTGSNLRHPSEQDSIEQDSLNKTQLTTPPVSPRGGTRGTRLPEDWVLPDEWFAAAKELRPDLTPAAIRAVADEFRDYWIAKAGQYAVKCNWFATWRNRIRVVRTASANGRQNVTSDDLYQEELAAIQRGFK